jgi:3-hydroxyisobutyrate dehydrogenase-like beta-hydroxyacid dehydrogenase
VTSVGFVGLGQMGSVLAANLAAVGFELLTYDVAGRAGSPPDADFANGVDDVAARVEVMVLSLPDGAASRDVASLIASAEHRRVRCVVNTSTVGITAAEEVAATLNEAGVGFVDAAVSGGPDGAKARTLMVMYAGSEDACNSVEPVLAGLTDRRLRVGDRPGMAQAAKLANNFLSATALAATSEAIAFAETAGVDMATMLEVLNSSSGQSTATSDKFPTHVLTGRYASGFANTLMAKDLRLYLDEAQRRAVPNTMGTVTAKVWSAFASDEPGVDFTRIYPFVRSARG